MVETRDGGTSAPGLRGTRILAAFLLLLLVLAVLPLDAPLAPAQAGNGTTKDMTFLLHSVNATETAKPLPGGGSALTYFDSTLDFHDANVSVLVEGTQKVLKWYLSPALAGDFAVEAFTLRMWANSSTSASSNAQVTVGLYEENATGTTLVAEGNLGSQSFPLTVTLKEWNHSFPSHTFPAGASIELRLTVNPGAMQGVWLHYDTPQVNSRLILRGPDSVDVATISSLNHRGNATLTFDPGEANKTVTFQATVTDPLGAFDVRWVNLTLTSPFDTLLLNNVSMTRVGGTPVDFESLYELEWNYSGQPNGPYAVEVWAVDHNGHNHYHFFQQFTYGPYPDVGNAAFTVGGPPFYVNVKAEDAAGGVLAGARVVLMSAGFAVTQNITNAAGLANLSLSEDTYEFRVFWQDVLVGSHVETVDANVSATAPLVLATQVYSPALRAQTADGSPLPGATFLLVHPNGTKLEPRRSDAEGLVPLVQVPWGNYSLEVSWRGVSVFSGTLTLESDDGLPVSTAVYELEVTATSGRGDLLPGVFVQATDETGLVFDAGVTDANGTVVLLLPQGSYTVQARYVTTRLGTLYDSGIRTTAVELTNSQSTTVAFEDFPVPLTSTSFFLLGLIYMGTVAGLLLLLLYLRRTGGSGDSDGNPSTP